LAENVTDKVSNQQIFTMPPQMTCASALPDKTGTHEHCIFTQMLVLVYFQNSTSRCLIFFFNLFDSRLIRAV